MSGQGFRKVGQHWPTLQTQCLHHRQDTFHKTAAALTATAERTFDGVAGRTGACLSLIFGDRGDQRGPFGDLMPRGFGVIRAGLLRQVLAAASASGRYKGDDPLQAFGRQASLQGGRMSGLAAGFFAGGLFDDGLGRLGRIGGGRQGGVGGVVLELLFEDADTLGERGELLLQTCDDRITLPASRARGFVHIRIL